MKRVPWLLLAFHIAFAAAGAEAGGAPRFKIETRGAERIEWSEEGERVLFSVYSRGGIGAATITPGNGSWPDRLAFRLYLKGLERFRVSNGVHTVDASVSSLPPHGVTCELVAPGEGSVLLTQTDPLWTPVVLVPENGASIRIPLSSGCIEVRPPEILLEGEPKALRIQWVDFFR